jgi:hypothetical protein
MKFCFDCSNTHEFCIACFDKFSIDKNNLEKHIIDKNYKNFLTLTDYVNKFIYQRLIKKGDKRLDNNNEIYKFDK